MPKSTPSPRNRARQGRLRPAFVATALFAALCAACSPEVRKSRHLESASRYFELGQYEQAEIEYFNVLKLDRHNPEAMARLGQVYFYQGRPVRAVPYLLRAVELHPDNLELRLKLGQSWLATGQLGEASEQAVAILAARPADPDAPVLLAEAAVRPPEIEAARRRLADLPGADGSAPVLVGLATLDLHERKLAAAEASLQRAQALAPESSAVCSALGAVYWAMNDRARAESALLAATKRAPARSPRRLQYARFKIQTGDLAAARSVLEDIAREAPDYLPAWIWLGEIALLEDRTAECARLVERALVRDPADPDARLLRARLRLATGATDEVVAELEQLVTANPNSAAAAYHLALAYLARGDTRKALAHLSRAVQLAPDFSDAILALAGLNLTRGEPIAAVSPLKQLTEARPTLSSARLLLADAYRALGRFDEARAVYRDMERDFSPNPQTPFLIGMVALQQNQPDAARREFARALEITSGFAPAVEQLVYLDLAANDLTTARDRVNTALAEHPTAGGLHVLQARVLLASDRGAEAEAALAKAIELQPDASAAYVMLAQRQVASGHPERALAQLREATLRRPKDLSALMLIASIHEQQKNAEAARDAYEAILAVDPRFTPALNNLACLYALRLGRIDRAHELARKARELSPGDPHVADTLGWILFNQRQYAWALTLLEESAARLPAVAEIQYHLGMARYMTGAEEPARVALEEALQRGEPFTGESEARSMLGFLAIDPQAPTASDRVRLERRLAACPDDPVALVRLAAAYEHTHAPARAITLYERFLQANPTNATARYQLARLYQHAGKLDQALEFAKAARKQEPGNAAISHLLGQLAYESGDHSWAVSLLQEADRTEPDQPEVRFDLALALYSVGRVTEAETAANDALRSTADFSRAEEARRWVTFVRAMGHPDPAVTAAAERVLVSNPTYVPALMLLAANQEAQPDLAASTRIYERIVEQFPHFEPAKRQLAFLYLKQRVNDHAALALATSARTVFADDPELAAVIGILFCRQRDFARAAKLLESNIGKTARDGELRYYLGMAQRGLNNPAGCRLNLERALAGDLAPDLAAEARRTLQELN